MLLTSGSLRTRAARRILRFGIPLGCALVLFAARAPAAAAPAARGAEHAEASDPAREEFLKINYVFNRGHYELALPRYEALLEKYPEFADRALVHYAAAVCHEALTRDRGGERAAPAAKDPAERTKRLRKAREHLLKALEDRDLPVRAQALALLGRVEADLGRGEEAARRIAAELKALSPEAAAETALEVAEVLAAQGNLDGAESLLRAGIARFEKAQSDPSAGPEALVRLRYELATVLDRKGGASADEALALFDVLATREGPYAERAAYMAAAARQRRGDAQGALERYRRLISSQDAEIAELARYGEALALFQLGRYEEAAERLASFRKDHPKSPRRMEAQLYEARALLKLGRLRSAARLLADLRTSDTVGPEANLWLARAYASRGKHDSAATILKAAIEVYRRHPAEPALRAELAGELLLLERYAEALELLKAPVPEGTAAEVVQHLEYQRAYALHKLARYGESTEACAQFLASHPKSPYRAQVLQLAAENRFLERDFERARALYRRLLDEEGPGLEPRTRLLAHFRLAEITYREGKYGEALQAFGALRGGELGRVLEEVLGERDPLYSAYHYFVADAALRAGDASRAEAELRKYIEAKREGPGSAEARLLLARILKERGKKDTARRLLEELAADPSGPLRGRAAFELAQIALSERDLKTAKSGFETFLAAEPESPLAPHALNALAWIAREEGRAADAERLYLELLARGPEGDLVPEALYGLARSLQAQGKHKEAEEAIKRLEREFPEDERLIRAQLEEVAALVRGGSPGEALRKIEALEPKARSKDVRGRLLYEKAWCLRRLGKTEEACAVYRDLLALEGGGEGASGAEIARTARLELADLLVERGETDEARKLLEPLAAAPGETGAKAIYQLAWILKRKGEVAALPRLYREAAEKHPESSYTLRTALLLAGAQAEAGRYEEASGLYRKVLEKTPPQELARAAAVGLAECLNEDRRFEEALRVLERYVKESPESQRAPRELFAWGWALENLGRSEEALKFYRKAARGNDEYAARAQFQIGQVLASAKRYRDAAVEFLQVPARYPKSVWSARSLLQVAGCFEALGEPDEARRYYQEVLEGWAERPEARLARERLERIEAP